MTRRGRIALRAPSELTVRRHPNGRGWWALVGLSVVVSIALATVPSMRDGVSEPESAELASSGTAPSTTVAAVTSSTNSEPSTVTSTEATGAPCQSVFLPPARPADIIEARSQLRAIVVTPAQPAGFDASLFPIWMDPDNDGFNADQQALGQQSLSDTKIGDNFTVVSGNWCSPYDGQFMSAQAAGAMMIDQVVSPSEAWSSGAAAWEASQREAFANDLAHLRGSGGAELIVSSTAAVTAKAGLDPAGWLPTLPDARCGYVANWVEIKTTWKLSMDDAEFWAVADDLEQCAAGRYPKRPVAGAPAVLPFSTSTTSVGL